MYENAKIYTRPFMFFKMDSITGGHEYQNTRVFEVTTFHPSDALGFTLLRNKDSVFRISLSLSLSCFLNCIDFVSAFKCIYLRVFISQLWPAEGVASQAPKYNHAKIYTRPFIFLQNGFNYRGSQVLEHYCLRSNNLRKLFIMLVLISVNLNRNTNLTENVGLKLIPSGVELDTCAVSSAPLWWWVLSATHFGESIHLELLHSCPSPDWLDRACVRTSCAVAP